MAEAGDALEGIDLVPLLWSSSSLLAAIADRSGTLIDANPRFRQLAARDPRGERVSAFVSEGQSEAFSTWLSGAGATWERRTWGAFPDRNGLPRDYRFAACLGAHDTLVLVGEPLPTDDIASALLDVNEALVADHRRLDRERGRLDKVAQQDALTGIANRRAFDTRLIQEVERATAGGSFALVMLDIDHFKVLNDEHGHATGDAVLRWLGGILRAAVRKGDLVARYGGEEFVAILTDAAASDAANWANRLRQAISRENPPGVAATVTVSLGVSGWHRGESGSELLARADRALYAAKRSGRDRVVTDGADEGGSGSAARSTS